MLHQFFNGDHPLLAQAYDPMTIRFFILQAHYRSTLDFGNDALQAAEKGLSKLRNASAILGSLQLKWGASTEATDQRITSWADGLKSCMDDDFNTAQTIAVLFDMATYVNALKNSQEKEIPSEEQFRKLGEVYNAFFVDILGLKAGEADSSKATEALDAAMRLLLDMRATAKANRDFATADGIRNALKEAGITVMDSKDGSEWAIEG
jgi:cysteinyl-tRNA synthetase